MAKTKNQAPPAKSKLPPGFEPAGDNRPSCYMDQRKDEHGNPTGEPFPVYRISALGGCPKSLGRMFEAGHVMDKRPWGLNKAAGGGNMWEQEAIAWLEGMGVAFSGEQNEIEIPVGKCVLRGHIDGIANVPRATAEYLAQPAMFASLSRHLDALTVDRGLLFEAKEMNAERFDLYSKQGLAGFPSYALQLSLYLKATGLAGALYVVGLRGRMSMDAGKDYHVHYIPATSKHLPSFAVAVRQVAEIEKHRKAGTLAPCNGKAFWCPFKQGEKLCEVDAKGKPAAKVIHRPDLEELIVEERQAKLIADYYGSRHGALNARLKAELRKSVVSANGQKLSITTDNPKVSIGQTWRSNFSTKLLEATHPEIVANEAYYTQSATISPNAKGLQVEIPGADGFVWDGDKKALDWGDAEG